MCLHGSEDSFSDGESVRVFLVQEEDALVAEDIEGSLRSEGECRIIRVRHPDDVSTHVADERRITAAILGMRFAQVVDSGLHRDLVDRGAHIVLTVGEDDRDRVQACGWGMLVRPFSDLMILASVKPANAGGTL